MTITMKQGESSVPRRHRPKSLRNPMERAGEVAECIQCGVWVFANEPNVGWVYDIKPTLKAMRKAGFIALRFHTFDTPRRGYYVLTSKGREALT